MHRGIDVHRCDAIRLGRHVTQLESLYRRCFTEPPWRETTERLAAFPDRLTRHLGHDGFDGLVAVEGGRLVGAVYGWPAGHALESGNRFDDTLAAAATPAVADRLVAPALIVAELMVDPGHQQRGIGSTLLTRFTAGWPAAWLCTHPDAPAAGMYRRGGWCEELRFTVDDYPMVLFTWRAPATVDSPPASTRRPGSARSLSGVDMKERNRQVIEQFRAGGPIEGMHRDRIVLLTTTGARTGQEHTTPMMFVRDGDRVLVLASNAGAPRTPDWFRNLTAHPDVTVEIGEERYPATAIPLAGAEYDEKWAWIIEQYPFFADHREAAGRQIPVVALVRR